MSRQYDIAFLGAYTKDTLVTRTSTKEVNGGAYFYGASAASRMGLKTAAVTRLAREDFGSFAPLEAGGVTVKAIPSAKSTVLKLDYPTDNPDDRILTLTSTADPFEPRDIEGIDAGVWSIGATLRGEVSPEVVAAIKAKGGRVGLDAQGFIRVSRGGTLAFERSWPDKERVLAMTDVFKADVVEAETLTGYSDLRKAAAELLRFGVKELVLTDGHGVLTYAEGEFNEAPFTSGSLIGRSGRGDTCLASYLAARISMKPRAATVWAAALTSLKMEKVGPFSGGREDVERAIRERY
jgi:sugar/nucleoside kinase (ribokinase family)